MRRTAVSLLTGLLVLAGVALAQTAGAVGWLGVYSQQITPELRDGINYSGAGALVSRVVPDSPADKAGIERGDVIVRVGSSDVDSPERLISVVRGTPVGDATDVVVIRDGQRKRLDVTLVTRPDGDTPSPSRDDDEDDDALPPSPMRFRTGTPTPAPDVESPRVRVFTRHDDHDDHEGEDDDDDDALKVFGDDPGRNFVWHGRPGAPGVEGLRGLGAITGRGRLGVRVESLSEDLGSYFGSRGQSGALVLDVTDDSPAEKAGVKAGDVITRVGDRNVRDADDLMAAVRASEGPVSLTVIRHGSTETLEATLPKVDRILRFQGDNGLQGGEGWKRGADGSWNWSSPDGTKRMKRIEIKRDKEAGPGDFRSDVSVRDREELSTLREELRQMREELRQLREERRQRDRERERDEDDR